MTRSRILIIGTTTFLFPYQLLDTDDFVVTQRVTDEELENEEVLFEIESSLINIPGSNPTFHCYDSQCEECTQSWSLEIVVNKLEIKESVLDMQIFTYNQITLEEGVLNFEVNLNPQDLEDPVGESIVGEDFTGIIELKEDSTYEAELTDFSLKLGDELFVECEITSDSNIKSVTINSFALTRENNDEYPDVGIENQSQTVLLPDDKRSVIHFAFSLEEAQHSIIHRDGDLVKFSLTADVEFTDEISRVVGTKKEHTFKKHFLLLPPTCLGPYSEIEIALNQWVSNPCPDAELDDTTGQIRYYCDVDGWNLERTINTCPGAQQRGYTESSEAISSTYIYLILCFIVLSLFCMLCCFFRIYTYEILEN
eukprot:UN33220